MKVPAFATPTPAIRRAIDDGLAVYDKAKADAMIRFVESFFRSQFAAGRLCLHPAQRQFLKALYGLRLKDGRRLIRLAMLHVPKKSFGKTMLAAAISLYELLASDSPSPLVVSAAASRENAGQVFDEVRYSIEKGPFKQFAKIARHKKEIVIKSTNASYRSLASEGKRLHGFNASCVVVDEAHVAPPELWHSLRWAPAARPNGLVVTLSTAGHDQTHWYHELYNKAKRVIAGEDDDPTHLPIVYEASPDDDPEDPATWEKANPLLGSAWCPEDAFRRDMQSAKASGPSEWLAFLRLRLNRWVRPEELAYFDVSNFTNLFASPSESELRRAPCAIGVDLSETTDPSSITISWKLDDGRYYTQTKAFIAEEGLRLRERSNLSRFDSFIAAGDMTTTPGDMIDERRLFHHIADLCKTYNVRTVHFDPRSAFVLANRLGEEGIDCRRVPPSARYFNAPMREIEKSLREGRLLHDGSGWLRFCLQNVRVQTNNFGEVYPVRKRSVDKIDGAISLCLSLIPFVEDSSKQTTTNPIAML
jgi:phage terminase large subunit-like protein